MPCAEFPKKKRERTENLLVLPTVNQQNKVDSFQFERFFSSLFSSFSFDLSILLFHSTSLSRFGIFHNISFSYLFLFVILLLAHYTYVIHRNENDKVE